MSDDLKTWCVIAAMFVAVTTIICVTVTVNSRAVRALDRIERWDVRYVGGYRSIHLRVDGVEYAPVERVDCDCKDK